MMDERMRRQWAASEAQACAWGGLSAVSAVLGMSPNTIRKGLGELAVRAKHPRAAISPRVRRPGGGRKRQTEVDPQLLDSLIRSTAARCLGELAVPEALEPLQHALKGDKSPSAGKIWDALRTLGWKPTPQPGMPSRISVLIFREIEKPEDKPADPEAYYLNIAGRVYGGFFPPIDQGRIVGVTAIPENVRLASLLYKKLVVEGKMDHLGVRIAHYVGRGPDFRNIIGLFFSMEEGTQAEPEADLPAEPAASGNPTRPQCRTVYNRREVIGQLRQANPGLLDFATWSAKFRCVKRGVVLTISGTSSE